MLAAPFAGQQRDPVWHTITGTVVDEHEQPVKGAKVCVSGTLPTAGRVPCGESNANGEFTIRVEHVDTYTIYAEHLERGYPIAIWQFYGKLWWQNLPKVVINGSSDVAPVKIRLGPKAGRLVLTILDGSSDKPIESGMIEVCRLGEPNSRWSISTGWPKGHYEILTPDVPFTIKFQTWHGPIPEYHGGVATGPSGNWVARNAFDDRGLPFETLQVALGQRKELTVRLK